MEAVLFFGVLWFLAACALYWIIRLAVHHGTRDADRSRRRADDRSRQQG